MKKFLQKVRYYYNLESWEADPEKIYGCHLENILKILEELLGEIYYEYKFLIFDKKPRIPIPDFELFGDDVILLFLSDEKSTLPTEVCDKFFAIFKSYYPLDKNIKNIVDFPMGYSNTSELTRHIPFDDRAYDVSFAGNFQGSRLDFYRSSSYLRILPPWPVKNHRVSTAYSKALRKLGIFKAGEKPSSFGNSLIYWTDGFAKGFSRKEYAEILSQTRVALCPTGFISPESFRLFEAMKLGCVLVVSDQLPPSRWYKNSPIIVEKNWLKINKVIRDLIKNPDELRSIHEQTLNWWNDVCSDQAVARYLADEILRLRAELAN